MAVISEKSDSINASQTNSSRTDTNSSSSKWYEDDSLDNNDSDPQQQQQYYSSASNNNSIVEASPPIMSQSATGIPIPANDKVYTYSFKFGPHTRIVFIRQIPLDFVSFRNAISIVMSFPYIFPLLCLVQRINGDVLPGKQKWNVDDVKACRHR